MPKINFQELWQKGADVSAQSSTIAGLHRMIEQRDQKITQLSKQIEENLQIMEQMEKQFVAQQQQIQNLQSRSSGSGPIVSSSGGSAEDKATINKLNSKIAELENKLYVFSNLPDRITELEAKLQKQTQLIDQYEDREEKYKDMVRKLQAEGGSQQLIQVLEEKVKTQANMIDRLQKELDKNMFSFGTTGAAAATSSNATAELERLRQQNNMLQNEKDQMFDQINQLDRMKRELELQLESAKKAVMSLQAGSGGSGQQELQMRISQLEGDNQAKDAALARLKLQLEQANRSQAGGASSPGVSSGELIALQKENESLKLDISELKTQLQNERNKIEDLVARVQKSSGTSDLPRLQQENQMLATENMRLKQELQEKSAMLNSNPTELVQDMNAKLSKLRSENTKLKEQLDAMSKGGAAVSPMPVKPGTAPASFKPAAPTIRSIDGGMGKDKEAQFNQEIMQLKRQIAEKDAQIIQMTQDLTDSQTKLAELKVTGPQDSGQANMMNLLSDLQTKIRKLKEQLRQKEEEIAQLKGG
jgi:chromosome segregation ATPase